MVEPEEREENSGEVTVNGPRNLAILTAGVLLVTTLSLGVSLWLYAMDGTAQLDLSRPGYEHEVVDQKQPEGKEFSSHGAVDRRVVDEFKEAYKERADYIREIDPFKPEPLGDEALGLDE